MTRRKGLGAGLSVVLLVAACGGGDDGHSASVVDLQEALDEELVAGEPGCVLAVGEDGEVVAVAARGLADLDSGEPLTAATVFDFASVSKQLTGALITVLADDGMLGLDDPLSQFVDGLADEVGAVTVHQLLHHTGGLPDYTEVLDTPLDESPDNDDVVAWLRTVQEPSFPPGSSWEYTNTGYVLLAEVAAAAGGAPFDELLTELVLRPAGSESFVRDYSTPAPEGTATSYADGSDPEVWRWNQQGDGGVHGTAADLIAWGHELATGDSLGTGWRDLMVADPAETDEDSAYGHGIFVDDDGLLSHDGGWQAFGTTFVTDPGDGGPTRTWVALCNRDDVDSSDVLEAALERTELPMP